MTQHDQAPEQHHTQIESGAYIEKADTQGGDLVGGAKQVYNAPVTNIQLATPWYWLAIGVFVLAVTGGITALIIALDRQATSAPTSTYAQTIVPPVNASAASLPSTPIDVITGSWRIEYYSDINLSGRPVRRDSAPAVKDENGRYNIKFNSIELNENVPDSSWSVRYSGVFYFQAGSYHFHCQHHDGCRIFVDGRDTINAWRDGEGGNDLSCDLSEGNHAVVVEFYDKGGYGFLDAWWELNKGTPSVTPALIPSVTHTPVPAVSTTPYPPLITDARGVQMALIPTGTFQMGSESGGDDEQPVHTVVLTSPFYMDIYEVTNASYQECLASGECVEQPACNTEARYSEHPVVCVTWAAAQTYCAWRGGSLPTEAQWEYAARGGLESMDYPWGNEIPVCNTGGANSANFAECVNSSDTVSVGRYAPNDYGLYDMAGNVWEWTADWYSFYKSAAVTDPTGPVNGEFRVLRGGSWLNNDGTLRAAFRHGYSPTS